LYTPTALASPKKPVTKLNSTEKTILTANLKHWKDTTNYYLIISNGRNPKQNKRLVPSKMNGKIENTMANKM